MTGAVTTLIIIESEGFLEYKLFIRKFGRWRREDGSNDGASLGSCYASADRIESLGTLFNGDRKESVCAQFIRFCCQGTLFCVMRAK